MSNYSKTKVIKVIPYCKDPMSSCGLFAYSQNTGQAPAGTVFQPMFFSGRSAGRGNPSTMRGLCQEGWEGVHPDCTKIKSKSEFSGYRNGEGDDDNGGANWSDKIDADTITAGLETAQGIMALFGNKRQLTEVEGACGKQPKFLAGRAKKQQWAQCASDYVRAQIEANKPKRERLSTGAWIGIGLGLSALVGGAIFLATRSIRSKQVIVMQAPPIK